MKHSRALARRQRAAAISFLAPLLAMALAAIAPSQAHALSSDRDQPINIEADSAEADENERVTIYRGNAIITQGTLSIRGETIWIYLSQDDEFIKLVSVGSPARMRQLPDGEDQYLTADAKRLEYLAEEDRILLIGDAVYGRGEDRVMAQRIEYDSRRGKMLAGANAAAGATPTEPGRVRIQIKPKRKTDDADN